MSQKSKCRCLICRLERDLTEQLTDDARQERYQQFAGSRSLLSAFPIIPDLIAYLRTCRSAVDGTHPADHILAELLRAQETDGAGETLRDMLLLALIPTVHSTSRYVAFRYPSLCTDDVAQHVVASLLEILASPEARGWNSHVGFALSRILKRNAFDWAAREVRSPSHVTSAEALPETRDAYCGTEAFERDALLRHFLYRCQREGLLTGQDIGLLVQYKLDASKDAKHGSPAAVYSNALRQRMKRLLSKLRRIARTP
jgi:hypothetical protein